MADNKGGNGQRPSLFMNAFREIHERLAEEFEKPEKRHDEKIKSASKEYSIQEQADSYFNFLKSIPYTEPWMIGIISFHLLCFVFILSTKNHWNTQYIVFFLLLVLVFFTERINEYAAENWRMFSTENYFDSNGLFISTVVSTPVLFNCLTFIVTWLHTASKNMIYIKRKQLQAAVKEEAKKENEETKKEK